MSGFGGRTTGTVSPIVPPAQATSVAAANVSSSAVNLSWVNGARATSVEIWRRVNGGTFTLLTTVALSTSYNDAGLNPVTLYEYYLVSRNIAGASVPSNIATALTDLPAGAPPDPPVINPAVAVSSSEIDVTWLNGGGAPTAIEVWRSLNGTVFTLRTTLGIVTAFSDQGLTPATPYWYYLIARNIVGPSAPSSTTTVSTQSTGSLPSVPTGFTATIFSGTQNNLAWSAAPGAATYPLEYSTNGVDWTQIFNGGATTFAHTGINTATTNHFYRLRGANGFLVSAPTQIICTVHPPLHTVTIDAAWLAANGPPWPLLADDTLYDIDEAAVPTITTLGSAFVSCGNRQVLKALGCTITYANRPAITITNGNFASGSGTTVPGWDITGAPAAVIATQPFAGFPASQCLKFNPYTTAQVILSDPFTLPAANIEYAASINPARFTSNGSTILLEVVDAITGAVQGQNTTISQNLGATAVNMGFSYAAVCVFCPSSVVHQYRLRVTLSAPTAGQTATGYMSFAAVMPSRDSGIIATGASASGSDPLAGMPQQIKSIGALSAYQSGKNLTVIGGTFVEGTSRNYGAWGQMYRGAPVSCYANQGSITLIGVTAHSKGMDPACIHCDSAAGNVIVLDCDAIGEWYQISNRQLSFAAFGLVGIKGNFVLDGCTVNGFPAQAVSAKSNSMTDPPSPVYTGGKGLITNNYLAQDARVTESYSIATVGLKNVEIAYNVGAPILGRGLFLDGTSGTDARGLTQNVTIHHNFFSAIEAPNLENDFTAMEATAVRVRTFAGSPFSGMLGVASFDNVYAASTDVGKDWQAIGCRISLANDIGQNAGGGLSFTRDTFRAIVLTANAGYSAFGISLSGVDQGTGLSFTDCIYDSNHKPLNFGDTDSFGNMNTDMGFLRPNFVHSAAGASRSDFAFIQVGYSSNPTTTCPVNNIRIVKPTYSGTGTQGATFVEGLPPSKYSGTITSAANTTPVRVTTALTHRLQTGDYVTITGNAAANGTHRVIRIDSTHFDLVGTTAAGIVAGGSWYSPKFVDFGTGLLTLIVTEVISHAPAPGATVTITDSIGNIVWTGTTDANGRCSAIQVGTTRKTQLTADPTNVGTTSENPLVVSVSYLGNTVVAPVTLGADADLPIAV